MSDYTEGDRVKIFYKVNGGFGLGTIWQDKYGQYVIPDGNNRGTNRKAGWKMTAFKMEKMEAK